MELKLYLASLPRGGQKEIAEKLKISPSFLSQLASGRAPLSAERCVAIEKATNGAVSRQELLPDSWQSIWPELTEKAA